MTEIFKPYVGHVVTAYPGGRRVYSVDLWRGDGYWPWSLHLTYHWRGVTRWHIWFFGL